MIEFDDVKQLILVIEDLSKAHQLSDIMLIVRSAARKIAAADGATFILRDEGYCFYAEEDAISPLWKGRRFPLKGCISGWSMLHKQQVIVNDIYQDGRIPHEAYRPTFVKSLVMTPIRKNDPIAAIGTYWSQTHLPTRGQLELLQALADSVSVAMENVNLYSSLNRHIEELKAANRAKDEFLMAVSHELRTPLNAILGWSEILSESGTEIPDARLGIQTIERNARSQSRIIEELLDTSRIILGRLHFEVLPIDLVPVVQSALNTIVFDLKKKKLQLSYSCNLDHVIVMGDSDRLHQIFSNLLVNALKFSEAGSEIKVSLESKGPSVQFKVEDFGIGITPEFLPHVFERFRQADNSLTRKHGGLGLGLAIVHYLTEAHRGQVTAESAGIGKGATFTVTLPLAEYLPT